MEMSAQKSFDGLKSARGRAKGSVTSFSRLPLDSILPYKCVDLPGALSPIPPSHRKCNNMFRLVRLTKVHLNVQNRSLSAKVHKSPEKITKRRI